MALPPSYFVLSAPRHLRDSFNFSFHAQILDVDRADFGGFELQPSSRRSAVQLYRDLVARRPALVHQHWATWSAPAVGAARRLGVPLVVSVHGYDAFLPRTPGRLGRVKDAAKHVERRAALSSATAVVVNSSFMAARVESLGVQSQRIHLIRHGIDTEYFRPASQPRRGIYYVGRLSPEKGGALFLEALAQLTGLAEPIVLIGDGPEMSTLKTRATELGVNATFLGSLPASKVRRHLQSARLLVCPSVPARGQAEASGIAPLEALACGTPVVVTKVGGLPENLPATLKEFACLPNATDLAGTISRALLMDRDELQEKTREHAVEKHSDQRVAREWKELYCRLIGVKVE
ncbi:glycosyltransferase family 4 protein [Microbacterium commune]